METWRGLARCSASASASVVEVGGTPIPDYTLGMRSPARAWPFLVIALVVSVGAPGPSPGVVFDTGDGQVSIDLRHAALLGAAAPASRGHGAPMALPTAPQPLPPPPSAVAVFATPEAAVAAGRRPLTTAAARAPPSPPPAV
jgi:hypothetical protein